MDALDLFFKKYSYKFPKGYPDMNNEQDVLLLESILSKELGFNVDLQEEKKLEYDVLTPKAKEIAQELIDLLGIDQSQIIPSSSTKIVIYNKDRGSLFDKIEQSGEYGKAINARNGNWKKNGISILVKPTGEKSGEYFELKPQQLGITLDKKIPLSTLKKELISGVKNNKVLSDLQKQALIYAVDKINPLSDAQKQELAQNTGFFNEVNKNFGEPHGALIYGDQIGADSVEFPAAGNYRLLDYILYKGDEHIQISAKAGKSVGNTAKYEDIIALVDAVNGNIPDKIREFSDIIKNNSVITGAFEAIEKFGDDDLKQKVKDYKIKYPQYPKLTSAPSDIEAHADRIIIEKDFIKKLNSNPEFNFNELFNNYVQVKYVKYNLNPKTLEAEVYVIESGNFNVKHLSKNSKGHDADKLGLAVSKVK
jgi:hypothetical protein